MLTSLLLAVLAAPPPAAAQTPAADAPAWAIDVPGAAGARWGIGANFERSELDGLAGDVRRASSPLFEGGDPPTDERSGLDLDIDLDLVGVRLPVSLGSFGSATRVYPFLVLEGGAADVEAESGPLERADREGLEPDRLGLDGDGEYYGASLGLAAAFGGLQGWFAEGRVGYLRVPDLEVSGTAALPRELVDTLALFAPIERGGELTGERWGLSVRLGRSLAGGRLAPYIGVRASAFEVEVETEARIPVLGPGPLGAAQVLEEIALEADDDTVSGFAGFDARLGARFFARAEAVLGDQTALRVQLVRLFGDG